MLKMYEERKPVVYVPSHLTILLLLFIIGLLVLIFPLALWGAFTILLRSVGWDYTTGFIVATSILVFSILLSPINIPVLSVEKPVYIPTVDFVIFYGIPYPVARFKRGVRKMVIAVNMGGAIIPTLISLYLIYKLVSIGFSLTLTLLSILLVTIFTYTVSRVIPGVGIGTPALLPPLFSALVAIILARGGIYAIPLSYLSGALGTLLGADVLRLWRDWEKLNAPVASIGGAGTFDGIYLTGVMAVALVLLLGY